MNSFKYILSLFSLLFTGLLFSCSEDSDVPDRGQEDDLCPVVIQIGSSESSQTRAFLEEDFEDHEYIHSLCVFLVNAETNLIEKKWMLDEGTSEPGGAETEKAGNITKWTSPEVLLQAGPKIIYAFANWETAQNETWNEIISRKENATLTQEELNNIAGTINRTIEMIEQDPEIQYCVNGRSLEQITGKEGASTTGRFPNLLNQVKMQIAVAALRQAQDNYNAKLNDAIATATRDASADLAQYMCQKIAENGGAGGGTDITT